MNEVINEYTKTGVSIPQAKELIQFKAKFLDCSDDNFDCEKNLTEQEKTNLIESKDLMPIFVLIRDYTSSDSKPVYHWLICEHNYLFDSFGRYFHTLLQINPNVTWLIENLAPNGLASLHSYQSSRANDNACFFWCVAYHGLTSHVISVKEFNDSKSSDLSLLALIIKKRMIHYQK